MLWALNNLSGQDCSVDRVHFTFGEKISYSVYYHWGFIWVEAGEASFSIQKNIFENRPVYHFIGEGKSAPKWDWMYKVRDRYESMVDTTGLFPLYFKRDVQEGSTILKEEYFFNKYQKSILTKVQKNNAPLMTDTLPFLTCMYDAISMVYYARCIPFNNYKTGDKIPITMLIDNEIHNLYIRYLGKETIKIEGKGTYETLKFSPLLVEGTIFKGGEGMTVWVSNDESKIPLKITTEILVGSIDVIFNTIEGVKNSSKK